MANAENRWGNFVTSAGRAVAGAEAGALASHDLKVIAGTTIAGIVVGAALEGRQSPQDDSTRNMSIKDRLISAAYAGEIVGGATFVVQPEAALGAGLLAAGVTLAATRETPSLSGIRRSLGRHTAALGQSAVGAGLGLVASYQTGDLKGAAIGGAIGLAAGAVLDIRQNIQHDLAPTQAPDDRLGCAVTGAAGAAVATLLLYPDAIAAVGLAGVGIALAASGEKRTEE